MNQCNRTNGTILLGRFYDCIFSSSYSNTLFTAYEPLQLLEEMLRDHICTLPTHASLTAGRMLSPASVCVFFHLFSFMRDLKSPASGGRQMEASQNKTPH